MANKRKPINTRLKGYAKNEIEFSSLTLGGNQFALFDEIDKHIKASTCQSCTWTFAVIGFDKLDKIKEFVDYDCLLVIYMELLFLQNHIEVLKTSYKLVENSLYAPIVLDMEGAVLLYCEPN